jgi:hypothetical protein
MHNRKDYIMDCAVELVDEGYPEAAELWKEIFSKTHRIL